MRTPTVIQLSNWLEAGGVFWLHWELRVAALLVGVAAAAWVCRRQSGALRHTLWTVGCVAVLLVPLLMVLLPEWRILPLPAQGQLASQLASPLPAVIDSVPRPIDLEPDAVATPPGPARTASSVEAPPQVEPRVESPAVPFRWPDWRGWVAVVFAAGGMACLVRLVAGQIALRRLLRRTEPAGDPRVLDVFRRGAATLGVQALPDLRTGCAGAMPMTWGLIGSKGILLPAEVIEWSNDRLSAVLLHELAHVRRHDCLTQFVAELVVALNWCNPLAHVARARMCRERETACDDLVLNCGHGDCDYAEHLLGVAAAVRVRHVSAAVAMARPASLESRIRLILDRGLCRRVPGRMALAALTILCALTLWPLAALRGRLARAQEPPVPPVLSQGKSVDLLVLEKSTGRPIEGAEVVYAINQKPAQVRTDAQGRCRISLDDLTNFSVVSRPRGFIPTAYVWWHPLSTKPPIPPELVFHHEPATTLGGIVRDEQGQPIADAAVALTMETGRVPGTEEHVSIYGETVQTDAQGRWTANVFPETLGELTIKLSHPLFLDATVMASSSPAVSIERLRAGDAVLLMRPGVRVRGRVLDELGNAVAGANVGFGVDADASGVKIVTSTDASGEFMLPNARPEQGKLVVEAGGYAIESRPLTPAADAANLEFRLKPGKRIELRVTDPDGKPLAGAEVLANVPRTTKPTDDGPAWECTDAAGRYIFSQAGDGPVEFSVHYQDFFFLYKAPFAPGKEHQVVLRPALVVCGTVVDDATGASINRGIISSVQFYSDGSGGASPYTEKPFENGRYSVKFRESSTRFGVRVSAAGYLPVDTPLVDFATAPAVSTFNLRLKKFNQPPLRIVRPDGRPAVGASVVVSDPGSPIFMSARNPDFNGANPILHADARGEVRFTPSPIEDWYLSITHEAGWALGEPAVLAKRPEIKLIPWGTLRGVVLVDGKPTEGIAITVSSHPPSLAADDAVPYFGDDVMSGRDGRFEFAKVPCRPLSLGRKASYPGHSTSETEMAVLVDPGEIVEVVLGKPGRTITGRIVLDNPGGPTWIQRSGCRVGEWMLPGR